MVRGPRRPQGPGVVIHTPREPDTSVDRKRRRLSLTAPASHDVLSSELVRQIEPRIVSGDSSETIRGFRTDVHRKEEEKVTYEIN